MVSSVSMAVDLGGVGMKNPRGSFANTATSSETSRADANFFSPSESVST